MGRAVCAGICAAMVGFMLTDRPARAADWPNFRGPNHDGICVGETIKTNWSGGPKVLWTQPIGSGFSAFACVGGKAYTCGTKNEKQVLFCLDANAGTVRWEVPIEKELKERQGGDGTRATPAVHEGRVYIFGARGTLLCVDAEKGTEVWKRTFGGKPKWAYSGSVLIEGDMAVVSPGLKDGALLAVDKKTGKDIWKCGNEKSGYGTPYAFTFEDKRYIAVFTAKSFIAADAKTGKLALQTAWETSYDVNASSQIYHNGHLFVSSGYKTGCALFKLSAQGDKLSAKEVWRSKVLMTKFRTPVLHEGKLYSGDQNGLRCVDFMTGKQQWEVRRMKHSSVLLAGEHLIVLSEKGKLITAKVSPKEFRPLAEAQILSGRCWTVPVLSNGKLYLRNLEKAVCLDLGPQVASAGRVLSR